jgi:hypothetical protein
VYRVQFYLTTHKSNERNRIGYENLEVVYLDETERKFVTGTESASGRRPTEEVYIFNQVPSHDNTIPLSLRPLRRHQHRSCESKSQLEHGATILGLLDLPNSFIKHVFETLLRKCRTLEVSAFCQYSGSAYFVPKVTNRTAPISLDRWMPCGYVIGAILFSRKPCIVFGSSRRSSFVPTSMMGVFGA